MRLRFVVPIAGQGGVNMATRILIAQLTNASPDDLDRAAGELVKRLRDISGVERTARYRRLNDSQSIVVAEFADGMDVPEALDLKTDDPDIAVSLITATEDGSRRREDSGIDPRDVPILYAVGFPVPEDKFEDVATWYEQEHMELLQLSSYWTMTRRFRVDPGAPKAWGLHLALHYLNDINALRSPERDYARKTPWRLELGAKPWFRGNYSIFLQELPL